MNNLDEFDPFWKVAGAVTAVLGMVGRGLYTSGRKYTEILNKMDQNNEMLVQVLEQQREAAKVVHDHDVRLSVVETKVERYGQSR